MQNWLKYENLQVWQCLGVTVSFPFISSDLNANAFSVIFESAKYILTIYSTIIILKIVVNLKSQLQMSKMTWQYWFPFSQKTA